MKWFLLTPLLFLSAFAGEVRSIYSSTGFKVVGVLSSSELEREPEVDHFEHLCPGYGGYELLHRSGDLCSWIDVRFKQQTSDLYAATMGAARGNFAHKANDLVEWRGILEGTTFTPYAIIYRINGQNIERPEQNRLLAGGSGPEARKIACSRHRPRKERRCTCQGTCRFRRSRQIKERSCYR